MNKLITSTTVPTRELKLEAIANISASFELLCLASGMEALGEMMEHDAQAICGPRHARGPAGAPLGPTRREGYGLIKFPQSLRSTAQPDRLRSL